MKKAINIIVAVLIIISLVTTLYSLFTNPVVPFRIAHQLLFFAVGIFILLYNFLWYKKPHGNLLRYIFLIYGCSQILHVILSMDLAAIPELIVSSMIQAVLTATVGIISVYVSGRLHKIERNKILIIIALIVLLASVILTALTLDTFFSSSSAVSNSSWFNTLFMFLGSLSMVFQWIALSLAYVSRFKAHKEAGLLDKPKA